MVRVNGEERDLAGRSLADYLEASGFCPERVAVERNGRIVPRAAYDETVFREGDEVEVVSFVGGG